MNRKLLNDVRKVMSRRSFLLQSGILKGKSKLFKANAPIKKLRLDKDSIKCLKSLSK